MECRVPFLRRAINHRVVLSSWNKGRLIFLYIGVFTMKLNPKFLFAAAFALCRENTKGQSELFQLKRGQLSLALLIFPLVTQSLGVAVLTPV